MEEDNREVEEEVRRKEREGKMTEEREREKEIEAFEGLLWKSKFNLNMQLSKTPAQISVLRLLLSSEPHCKQFLDIFQRSLVKVNLPP